MVENNTKQAKADDRILCKMAFIILFISDKSTKKAIENMKFKPGLTLVQNKLKNYEPI